MMKEKWCSENYSNNKKRCKGEKIEILLLIQVLLSCRQIKIQSLKKNEGKDVSNKREMSSFSLNLSIYKFI